MAVLTETGWTTTRAPPDAAHDVEARKETPAEELLLVRLAHHPDNNTVEHTAVDDCALLRRERPDAETVMLVTSSSLRPEGTRYAREREVRLLDDECLGTILESRGLENAVASPRIEAE